MSRLFHLKAFEFISKIILLSLLSVSCNSLSPRDKGYALKKRPAPIPNSSLNIFGNKNQYHQQFYNIRQDLTSTNSRVTTLEGDVRQIRSNPVLSSNYNNADMNKFRPTNAQSHIVKKGETLTLIARQHGVSINSLVQNNGIKNPDIILTGQKLIVNPIHKTSNLNPTTNPQTLSQQTQGNQYKVLEGDTINRIAKSHGISNETLIASNSGINPDQIQTGQIIKIPTDQPEAVKETENKSNKSEANIIQNPEDPDEIIAPEGHGFYQVSSGDTLHSIAVSFGTDTDNLRKLNKISNSEGSLKVGDYILVPVPDESLYES
ncbi:MAG: LysM peptidoglycan-binding domain-containing protein [Verrucomicrobiota bacterium]|nr:LysM peptidoglycan-binding domain-containing protein [Verrucomicrobiota bacterium]